MLVVEHSVYYIKLPTNYQVLLNFKAPQKSLSHISYIQSVKSLIFLIFLKLSNWITVHSSLFSLLRLHVIWATADTTVQEDAGKRLSIISTGMSTVHFESYIWWWTVSKINAVFRDKTLNIYCVFADYIASGFRQNNSELHRLIIS